MKASTIKVLAGLAFFLGGVFAVFAWPAAASFFGLLFMVAMFVVLIAATLLNPLTELSTWQRTPGENGVQRRHPQHFNNQGVVHAPGE